MGPSRWGISPNNRPIPRAGKAGGTWVRSGPLGAVSVVTPIEYGYEYVYEYVYEPPVPNRRAGCQGEGYPRCP